MLEITELKPLELDFEVLNRDNVNAHITVYGLDVNVEYFTDFPLDRPFGKETHPSFDRFLEYMESRCVPRTRANIDEFLKYYGFLSRSIC